MIRLFKKKGKKYVHEAFPVWLCSRSFLFSIFFFLQIFFNTILANARGEECSVGVILSDKILNARKSKNCEKMGLKKEVVMGERGVVLNDFDF